MSDTTSRPTDSGFVLVGVVMFVLALTTLGLSLFALSSYESQFLMRSMHSEQAFNAASSGLERARHRLMTRGILADVAALAGSDDITSAVAVQVKAGVEDSTGMVQFGGNDIRIRVTATVTGHARTLEAWFGSQAASINVYKRLMALARSDSALWINNYDALARERWPQVRLNGQVWMNGTPETCDSIGPRPSGIPPDTLIRQPSYEAFGGVPMPDLASYFASRWAGATAIDNSGNSNNWTLSANGYTDNVRWFKTVAPDPNDEQSEWSLKIRTQGLDPAVAVQGTAIWMFDRGAFFQRTLTVSGPTNALLILVARPTTDQQTGQFGEKGAGLAFNTAIVSTGPGVVLISDGRVAIETDYQVEAVSSVGFLTVFAKQAQIMGPADLTPGGFLPLLTLSHPSGHALDTRLDELWDKGYLPNATGGPTGAMTMRSGSWRQYPN